MFGNECWAFLLSDRISGCVTVPQVLLQQRLACSDATSRQVEICLRPDASQGLILTQECSRNRTPGEQIQGMQGCVLAVTVHMCDWQEMKLYHVKQGYAMARACEPSPISCSQQLCLRLTQPSSCKTLWVGTALHTLQLSRPAQACFQEHESQRRASLAGASPRGLQLSN